MNKMPLAANEGPDRIDRPRTLINHAGLLERFDEWGVIAPVQINEILQLQVPNETREKND